MQRDDDFKNRETLVLMAMWILALGALLWESIYPVAKANETNLIEDKLSLVFRDVNKFYLPSERD